MKKPVIILGAGGHAKVVLNILRMGGFSVLGVADPVKPNYFDDVIYIDEDQKVLNYSPDSVLLVNGLGSVRTSNHRKRLYNQFIEKNYHFMTLVHPSAVVASDVIIGEGAQIMAGAIIQPGCNIGVNTIVNTGAILDHDCVVGAHVHLAPGATLSGGIKIGEGAHIGTGATIIQGVCVGENSTIGAGAVVISNIKDNCLAVGIPAKEVRE